MADYTSFFRKLKGASVLGVNPPVHDFAFFDLWAKPAGLLFLLDFLRRGGNEVSLIDCIFEGRTGELSWGRNSVKNEEIPKPAPLSAIPRRYRRFGLGEEEFAGLLARRPAPDIILVTSMMTYWYEGVFSAIKTLRQVFPAARIILGGVYARLCPEHALRAGADMVQTAPLDLDFSLPAFDLYRGLKYGVLITSFGCPFRCEYCASSALEPLYKARPRDLTMADTITQLASGEVRDLAFYDDALLWDKRSRLYPLLERLKPWRARLHTPNGLHVREIDDEYAAILKKSGFQTIRLSFESSDALIQHKGSDKVSEDEYMAALDSLKRAGFSERSLETYILAGVPGQSVDSVERSIRFVRRAGGLPRIAEFSPVPGTVSFEEAAEAMPALREEPLLSNKTAYSSWLSGAMTPAELQGLKDLAKKGR
ncbi:MAG: radical SAM protein [Synergistaceae bacterium]|nr:radical SAM protein [Synergistaceae bacterium]